MKVNNPFLKLPIKINSLEEYERISNLLFKMGMTSYEGKEIHNSVKNWSNKYPIYITDSLSTFHTSIKLGITQIKPE